MTQEQIDRLNESISNAESALGEIKTMLQDYAACKSETSKKYLAAAVKKQLADIPNVLKPLAE